MRQSSPGRAPENGYAKARRQGSVGFHGSPGRLWRDGLDVVIDAGAAAVVQPGGSLRDDQVIAAADERGIAMVLTGMRHFRH